MEWDFFVSVSFVCFCFGLGYCLCLTLGHLLRLLLVMVSFVSALPDFDRSIAVGWKSFNGIRTPRIAPGAEPQLNIVLFLFLFLSCCIHIKSKQNARVPCVLRKRKATTATCCGC